MTISIPQGRTINLSAKAGSGFESSGLAGSTPGVPTMDTPTKTATSITGVVLDANGATSFETRVDAGTWISGLTASGLTAETLYSVEWRGINANGAGPATTPVNVTTDAAAGAGIDSVTGTFATGNTITLNGSGFTSTGGIPVKFDDFDDGTNGQLLSARGWSTETGNGGGQPTVSNADSFTGTLSGRANCDTGSDSLAYLDALNVDEIYISLFMKGVVLTGSPDTTKGLRAHGDIGPNTFTSYPGFMIQEPLADFSPNAHRYQINQRDTGGTLINDYSPTTLTNDTWYHIEVYHKLGNGDGTVKYWNNLSLQVNRENEVTRDSTSTTKLNAILLPFYFGNGGTGYWYYDNVYISKGPGCLARVEIGDDPTYESCTKREVLNTTSRSDTAIQCDVPSHTFPSSSTGYLFALDDTGSVIGSSFAIGVQ